MSSEHLDMPEGKEVLKKGKTKTKTKDRRSQEKTGANLGVLFLVAEFKLSDRRGSPSTS